MDGRATNVSKVRCLATFALYDVLRCHAESSRVADDANIPRHFDVLDVHRGCDLFIDSHLIEVDFCS